MSDAAQPAAPVRKFGPHPSKLAAEDCLGTIGAPAIPDGTACVAHQRTQNQEIKPLVQLQTARDTPSRSEAARRAPSPQWAPVSSDSVAVCETPRSPSPQPSLGAVRSLPGRSLRLNGQVLQQLSTPHSLLPDDTRDTATAAKRAADDMPATDGGDDAPPRRPDKRACVNPGRLPSAVAVS